MFYFMSSGCNGMRRHPTAVAALPVYCPGHLVSDHAGHQHLLVFGHDLLVYQDRSY